MDHGAEHQWLKETEARGYHHAAAQAKVLAMSFLNKVLEVRLWGLFVSELIMETHLKVLCVKFCVINDFHVDKSSIYCPSIH